MSEKLLKIKLQVDTTDSGKLREFPIVMDKYAQSLENAAKKAETLQSIEKKNAEILAAQQVAYDKVTASVERIQNSISSGKLNSALGLSAATSSITAYNKKIQETEAQLTALSTKRFTFGIDKESFITGKSAAVRQLEAEVASFERLQERINNARPTNRAAIASDRPFNINGDSFLRAERARNEAILAEDRRFQSERERIFREGVARISTQQTLVNRINSAAGINTNQLSERDRANQQRMYESLFPRPRIPDEDINSHRNLFLRVGELIGAYRIWDVTLHTVWNSLKAIPRVGIELESTISSLTATFGGTRTEIDATGTSIEKFYGSATGAGSAMVALNKEAERTGIDIKILRENFRGFQASTSLAGASLESTWKMFTNLNTVITGLHLSADRANGIFLAMAQIFNKGKVQSEELVKQLGNLLPGAFASFAASIQNADGTIGISGQELSKRMKAGTVSAKETMEDFTDFMANRFAPAFVLAQSGLNANVGRLQTSFTKLGESIYNSTSGPLLSAVKGLTSFGDYLRGAVEGTNNFGSAVKLLSQGGIAYLLTALARATAGLFVAKTTLLATGETAVVASAAMRGLSASLAFLTSPTALVAGLGTLIWHFHSLASEAADAKKRIDEAYNAKPAEVLSRPEQLKLDIANNPEVKKAEQELSDLAVRIQKVTEAQESYNKTLNNPVYLLRLKQAERTYGTIRDLTEQQAKEEEVLRRAQEAATLELTSRTNAEDITAFEEKESTKLKISIERLSHEKTAEAEKQKALLQFDQQYAAIRKQIEEGIEKNKKSIIEPGQKKGATEAQLEAAKEAMLANETLSRQLEDLKYSREQTGIEAVKNFNATIVKEEKKTQTEQLKNARQFEKDSISDAQTYSKEISNQLALLQNAYSNSSVSIEEYFAKKEELQVQDLDRTLTAYREAIKVAESTQDLPKLTQLVAGKNSVTLSANAQANQDLREKKKALEEFDKLVQETQLDYERLVNGDTANVVNKAFDIANKERIAKLTANLGQPGAKGALDSLNSRKAYEASQAQLDLQHKQEDALAAIDEGYRNVGVTAATVLGSQLSGIQQVVTAMDNYKQTTDSLVEKQRKLKQAQEDTANLPAGDEKTKQEEVNAKAQIQLTKEVTKNKLSSLSLIASATSSMFKQGSKEAAIANSAAIAFSLAQQIRELAALPVKGAAAILGQAQGDPYTAFARMAAMAATVAALISSVGGAFGGGGSVNSSSAPTSTGTGTVLGDKTAESTSLGSSLQLLADINYKSYLQLTKLNDNITGILKGITGITTYQAQGNVLNSNSFNLSKEASTARSLIEGAIKGVKMINTVVEQLPVVGKLVGGLMQGVSNWIANGIFGKTTSKVTDVGIQTNKQLAGQLLIGMDASIKQYTTIEEKTKSWFSSSTKIFDITTGASATAVKVFTGVFNSVTSTMKQLAEGLSSGAVDAVYRYNFPALKISLKGKTAEQISKKLNAVLSAQLDKMATAVFGGVFGDLQAVGEGMFQTVSRLYTEKAVLTKSFKDLGVTVPSDNIAFIKLADSLVQAGSSAQTASERLKEFATAEQDFYKAFTSSSKQSKDNMLSVADGLANIFNTAFSKDQVSKVGAWVTDALTKSPVPATYIDGFETLQDIFLSSLQTTGDFSQAIIKLKGSIDLTTKTGLEAYNSLNSLTDSMKTYASSIADIKKPLTDQITALNDTIDLSTQAQLLDQLSKSKDLETQKTLTVKIQKLIMDKYNTEVNAIKSLKTSLSDLANTVKNLLLGNLSTLSPLQKLNEARSQYTTTLAAAKTDPAAAAKLSSIAEAYLTQAKAYYADTSAYAEIFKEVTSALSTLSDFANSSAIDPAVQATVDLAQGALGELKTLSDTLGTAFTESLKTMIANAVTQQQTDTTTAAATPPSTLEKLYTSLATAPNKAAKTDITEQISAYNAGFKITAAEAKKGQVAQQAADQALAAVQDRQAQKDTLTAQQEILKAATKAKDKAKIAEVKALIAQTKAKINQDTVFLKSIGFKANGGAASGPTFVGERGIEFVNLPTGSSVTNNDQVKNIIIHANEESLVELRKLNKGIQALDNRLAAVERSSRLAPKTGAFQK